MQQDMTNNVNFILFKIAILTISSAEGIFIDADAAGRDYIRFLNSMDAGIREKYMADVAKRYETKSCGKFMGRDYDMQEIIAFDAVKLFKAKQNRHPYYMSQDGQFIVSEDKVKKVKKKRPQLGKDGKPVIELDPSEVIILKPGQKLNEDGKVIEAGQNRPRKKRPPEQRERREENSQKIRRPIVEESIAKKEPLIKRPREDFEVKLRPVLNKEKILQRNAAAKPKREGLAAEKQKREGTQSEVKRTTDSERQTIVKPRETDERPREEKPQNAMPKRSPVVDRMKRPNSQRIIIKSEIIIRPTSKNGIRTDILSKIGTHDKKRQSIFQKTIERKVENLSNIRPTVIVNVKGNQARPIVKDQTTIARPTSAKADDIKMAQRPTITKTRPSINPNVERARMQQREELQRRHEEMLKRREAQRRELEARAAKLRQLSAERAAARAERLKQLERERAERRTARPVPPRPSMQRMAGEPYESHRQRPSMAGRTDTRTRVVIDRKIAERRAMTRRRLEEIEKRRALIKQQTRCNPHISYEIHIG